MITDLFRNRLARRLGMYVILVSTFITIFTSGIQLYFEFERDVEQVNGHLDQIEKTQLGNIVSRVWVVDINELQNALDRIINLQAIQYIAVYDENNHLLAQSGAETGNKNPVIKKHSLHYFHNDKTFNIGSLIVEASLDGAYQRIIDHALMIIATNALKTFIVAGFILIIFFAW